MAYTPSPELKELIKVWCKIQEDKYGPDWKSILAAEMSRSTIASLNDSGLLISE